ncbi:RagB/SusD family nutrient uptake outer membrane protein [Rhodohalobacter sp. 614A]|uniref:RagB/SusD family nutrient uptake outer membrane protein n=1 Tax=Rhodohalobacter sp. 614A TaxID=2908649 RepID=UPI001F2B67EF|nr:RagB/SusD family nutrient uptake outer membrane protein [Rhodohalobacter sp. 614A]
MLKKIFLLPISLLILGIAGCQPDLLETVPTDRVSSDIFWETVEDAEAAANAAYVTLDGEHIFSYDGVTDHAFTNAAFDGDNFDIQRGIMSSSMNRFDVEWNRAYVGIRRANDFMNNIDNVDGAPELINQYTGEVKTIRAYHYIKLVMLFGDVPLITTPIDIQEGLSVSRTSAEQIWDFIETELEEAASLLPAQNGLRISKGTANGLKARAMLYAERFEKAAEAAKRVIDSNVYSLYPSYFNLFQYEGEGNSEVLLAKEYAPDINSHNIYAILAPASQIEGQTGSGFVPTASIIDLYEMDNGMSIDEPGSGFDPMNPYENRDPRLKASVFISGETVLPNGNIFKSTPPGDGGSDNVELSIRSTKTGFNIRKYVADEDYGNPSNSGLNITLLRYAEVLLTYAEAKIEMNQIDPSVYEAINKVRQRESVNMPAITAADASSQSEMRDIVRKERAVELAFEGHRLFDIRRWEIAEDVIPGRVYGARYVENGEPKQIEVTFAGEKQFNASRDYLWPIPSTERALNSNLTQNPGW